MKIIKTTVCLFFTLNAYTQRVQLPNAGVYTIVGKASVKRHGKLVILKQKDYIFDNDTIMVGKSSALTLFTKEFKYLEIRQPGMYPFSTLSGGLDAKPVGISKKFAELLWHEFFKPENIKSIISPSAIGGAIGGASRGECSLLIEPSNNLKLSNDTLFISWRRFQNAKKYRLTLEDNSQNELLNVITKDTTIVLLKRGLLKGESNQFTVTVTPDNDLNEACSSSKIKFTLFSVNESKIIIEALLKQEPSDTNEFLYNIKVSNALALNGWYYEAYEYYLKAMPFLK
jgi:hypothetical protein